MTSLEKRRKKAKNLSPFRAKMETGFDNTYIESLHVLSMDVETNVEGDSNWLLWRVLILQEWTRIKRNDG